METVLEVNNLSKQYRLGLVGTGTMAHDLNRLFHKIRGKSDPYSLVGEVNDRSKNGNSDFVMALNKVSFSVEKGEILGIIGKNGAGKSTLLKMLSKITSPSAGNIKIKGSLSSLLEVGTGFHPELTGRENIFLNGAILGMRKSEIEEKLSQIVEFAGVERYLDTPVKRYSSGMTVRLGFSVAAHLEPDILVVDEVLAVGDQEFQKKCIGKMQDVSKEGRTVLFVSHNMGSIASLCTRCIYMKNGELYKSGSTAKMISLYLESESKTAIVEFAAEGIKKTEVLSISCKGKTKEIQEVFDINEDINIEIIYKVNEEQLNGLLVALLLSGELNTLFYTFSNEADSSFDRLVSGVYRAIYKIPAMFLKSGKYYISVNLGLPKELIQGLDSILSFSVEEQSLNSENLGLRQDRPGLVVAPGSWSHSKHSLES